MTPPKDHPVVSVLANGICREINEARKLGLVRASLILLYNGLDQVSYLAMPVGQTDATRKDFIAWAEKYLKLQGNTVVTGLELYAARCGLIHKYGTEANLHLAGKVDRQIGYVVEGPQKVYADASVPNLILIEFHHFVDAFMAGVTRFMHDVMEHPDADYRNAINDRLHSMLDEFALDEH